MARYALSSSCKDSIPQLDHILYIHVHTECSPIWLSQQVWLTVIGKSNSPTLTEDLELHSVHGLISSELIHKYTVKVCATLDTVDEPVFVTPPLVLPFNALDRIAMLKR